MKKVFKRIGAVALAACMMLSVLPCVSAAADNTLVVKVSDTNIAGSGTSKTVTMKNSNLLGDDANLIASIFEIIGGATMGDGLSNTYKDAHKAHIAQGKSIRDAVCTPANCGLYAIWNSELDDWFDNAKDAYLNDTWSTWISTNVDDSLFSNTHSDGELKDLMENTASQIGALELEREYVMTSHNGRYIFSVTRTKHGGGGGSVAPSTTTETIENEDGSVTTIITDKKTGIVTEITTGKNGVTATTVTDKNGNSSPTEVVIPDGATEPVKLPDPVKNKEPLNVDVPNGGAEIEIPVKDPTPGNVVVIVHPDGTEEVIKNTNLSENGVVVELEKDATVKVVDKSKHFVDIDGHWAENAINYVAARGLFAGTGDGTTFSPEMKLTRAMMAQVIYNLEGAEKHNYSHGFPDVPGGMWYTDAINWAAREGVVAGYGDGLYRPDKLLSREEVVQIFFNYAKSKGYDVSKRADLSGFVDHMTISEWARVAKKWGVGAGLIAGKGGGIIDPLANTTRAECAQMFMNFMERIIND